MIALIGDMWYEPAVAALLGHFLDSQFENYMKQNVPQEYLDEFSGLTAGGLAAGIPKLSEVGKIAIRGIVLANFPGDIENIKLILKDEYLNGLSVERANEIISTFKSKWSALSCSMFGTWGSRTLNGDLYSGRNLDWLKVLFL